MAQQFASESRDRNLSAGMEGQIMAYYSDFGIAANLVEVECRTTLCRVVLTLPELLPRQTPLIVDNDDGRPAFAVGEELGMDTIFIFRGQDPNGAYIFRSYLRFEDSTTQSIAAAGETD
jgi:hypothetical protein